MKLAISITILSTVVFATPSLDLQITVSASAVDINGLVVKTILTNVGDETLKILNDPTSILSTIQTDKFTIASNASAPSFTGVRVKYSPSGLMDSETAFTILEPYNRVEKTHRLFGVYDFSQSGEGLYNIAASSLFQYLNGSGSFELIRATSKPTQFHLGGLLAAPETVTEFPPAHDIAFNKCSPIQQNTIRLAAERADGYVDQALAFLARRRLDGDQYAIWFGHRSSESYSNVVSGFEGIGHRATRTTYDCDCRLSGTDEGVFAYVYPDTPGTIRICSAFWNAPLFGPDSQAGTIVQANSHFTGYADASDIFYGQRHCRDLAAENPLAATQNADNFEYFAETMPAH